MSRSLVKNWMGVFVLGGLGACNLLQPSITMKNHDGTEQESNDPSDTNNNNDNSGQLKPFDRFDQITDATAASVIISNIGFTEGPLWHPEQFLVFSHAPITGGIMAIYMYDSLQGSDIYTNGVGNNGLTLDKNKKIVACDQDHRRIAREEGNGNWVSLGDTYMGKKLNRPNDCVVKSDGVIYFTDPDYGLPIADKELDFNGVHRVLSDGTIDRIAENVDFQLPNGLAFTPDEKSLYVGDNGKNIIWKFEVQADGTLDVGEQLIKAPDSNGPDGMKVDTRGHIYIASRDGVRVFHPDGHLLGTITTPEAATNCAFGGSDYKTLFITTGKSVYKAQLKVAGVAP